MTGRIFDRMRASCVQPAADGLKAAEPVGALFLLGAVAQLPPVFGGHASALDADLSGLVLLQDARERAEPALVHGQGSVFFHTSLLFTFFGSFPRRSGNTRPAPAPLQGELRSGEGLCSPRPQSALCTSLRASAHTGVAIRPLLTGADAPAVHRGSPARGAVTAVCRRD